MRRLWRILPEQREEKPAKGSSNISSIGWYMDNSESKTCPVAQKKPNEPGNIITLDGNVYEWRRD
jgi:formylglycine-generating enzyme